MFADLVGPGHPFGSTAVLCMSSTISVIATLSTDRMAYALAMPMNPIMAITYLLEQAPVVSKTKHVLLIVRFTTYNVIIAVVNVIIRVQLTV